MKILQKDKLDEFLQKLGKEYDLYGPVLEEANVVWSTLKDSKNLLFGFSNTDLSPKEFFFPQTERLLNFKNSTQDPEGMIMKEEPGIERPFALINIRPCDAKAFSILDKVFCRDEESTDVYWKEKRDKALLIGLACNDPCPTCFCTSVNCGPHYEEGLDILMVDLKDKLLLKPITSQGEKIISDLPEAADQEVKSAEELKEKAESSITSSVATDKIAAREVMEVYELPVWDRVHESCLNCGTCTYYCPTCHCFDIQDEVQGDYGRRVRNWDSCMSWLFTYHTSGHNPRGTKKDRVRQRFMHKFKYMPIKLQGAIGCVGCGRCTQKCPVNIDVREVVNNMNQ